MSNDIGKFLVGMIEETLNLQRWGFRESFQEFGRGGMHRVIYDSQWCRVRFDYSRGHNPTHDEIHIYYGRLPAPNDDLYIISGDQKCRCWHNVVETLYFLDGLSAAQVVEQQKRGILPAAIEEFIHTEKAEQFRNMRVPYFSIAREAVIWNHYGQGLFEVFDVRRTDKWDAYRQFVKRYHEIMGSKPLPGYPPYSSIC
jgi:hypothetical protein